ncbi:MAG: GNAT family N-acetyltransferase [Treponema sp.]|nr:GNAT family N-acetyltransferase [Treponema sp.]
METSFDKACAEDFDDVVDLANYVFSNAHRPCDFKALLPNLFRPEYFMDGIHYLARENGKIKAIVGAYPLEIEFAEGGKLPGRGIGTVSVHPYCRSKGYMKVLMKMALEDMRRDGMVFSCLGGQRQRYEYFGYTPVGSVYTFSCNEANISHTLGRQWKTGLTLEKLDAADDASIDRIRAMHDAKGIRLHRGKDRLFDILSSWKAETFVVTEAGRFEGYLVHKGQGTDDSVISEINLKDFSRLPEVVGLFLRGLNGGDTKVCASLHEHEKTARLSGFAEGYTLGPAYQFAVFDHARFADAFVKFRAGTGKIREGAFAFRVEDKDLGIDSHVRLFADKTGAGADGPAVKTGEAPALKMNSVEATGFLACLPTALSHSAIRGNEFLRDILPLPVFCESADGI